MVASKPTFILHTGFDGALLWCDRFRWKMSFAQAVVIVVVMVVVVMVVVEAPAPSFGMRHQRKVLAVAETVCCGIYLKSENRSSWIAVRT